MLDRILNVFGLERRSAEYNPAFEPGNWGRASAPHPFVTPQAVLSNSAVACRAVELKATLLASTSVKLFRMLDDGGRERVRDDAVARLLLHPNDDMTGYEFFELLSRSLDLHGNFFARIERNASGEPTAMHPIDPATVLVERVKSSGRLRYRVTATNGSDAVILFSHEMLHVKNSTRDGLIGQSPLSLARASLGLAIAETQTAANLASNALRPSAIVSVPNAKISPDSRKALEDKFNDYGGPYQSGKVVVLEGGAEWKAAAFSALDAQLLESRKLSGEDTARIMGVPPAALGLTNTVSYGSAAQAAQDLVTTTLGPLAARIEAAIARALISPDSDLFVEFDLSSLLRADPTARWQTYQIGRKVGALSPNDIRKFENLPPIDGGDVYQTSLSEPRNDGGASDP